jgi:hypothetical protein
LTIPQNGSLESSQIHASNKKEGNDLKYAAKPNLYFLLLQHHLQFRTREGSTVILKQSLVQLFFQVLKLAIFKNWKITNSLPGRFQ